MLLKGFYQNAGFIHVNVSNKTLCGIFLLCAKLSGKKMRYDKYFVYPTMHMQVLCELTITS